MALKECISFHWPLHAFTCGSVLNCQSISVICRYSARIGILEMTVSVPPASKRSTFHLPTSLNRFATTLPRKKYRNHYDKNDRKIYVYDIKSKWTFLKFSYIFYLISNFLRFKLWCWNQYQIQTFLTPGFIFEYRNRTFSKLIFKR